MYIIAGLGNPTRQYENTRHNVGFEVIDLLADRMQISVTERKFHALCGGGYLEGQKVLLLKPQTYMNLSGESIAAAVQFYKCDPEEELIVICDDINLDVGRLRVRKKGSAGGHNGLKNIIAQLHTEGFSRIRVGVGKKPEGWDLVDFVLGHLYGEEAERIAKAQLDAAAAAAVMVSEGTDAAMNRFNKKPEAKKPKGAEQRQTKEDFAKKSGAEECAATEGTATEGTATESGAEECAAGESRRIGCGVPDARQEG